MKNLRSEKKPLDIVLIKTDSDVKLLLNSNHEQTADYSLSRVDMSFGGGFNLRILNCSENEFRARTQLWEQTRWLFVVYSVLNKRSSEAALAL